MPGGRLTRQDRDQIAQALTQGLGYAEIARALARPTSTVSREVARNGGNAGYRAGDAQEAARRRARRRGPARTAPAVSATQAHGSSSASGRDDVAVHDFEDQFAAMMIQTGSGRMMARVLASLLTSDSGGRTAAELVQWLGVSPASISKAVGVLEQSALVTRESVPGQRRERYVIGPDVWCEWITRAIPLFVIWADAAAQGVAVLGPDTPGGARLDATAQFFDFFGRESVQTVERWRQLRAAPHPGRGEAGPTAIPGPGSSGAG